MTQAAANYVVDAVPQAGSIPCGYCLAPFTPKKSWQLYCSAACRTEHNVKKAAEGLRAKVSSVRCLRRGGVSVTIQFSAIERDRALKLEPGILVGVTTET